MLYRYALTALVASIFNASSAMAQSENVSCDTSGNSPLTADAQQAIDMLKAKGATEQCEETHGSGTSQCTYLEQVNSAGLSICGDVNFSIACTTAANYLQQILNQCQGANGSPGDLVGGSYSVDGYNRVEIIKS